jgi:FG-GAP repeat
MNWKHLSQIGLAIFLASSIFCINHPSWAYPLFLPAEYAVVGNPISVAIGDFNGDGHQDLAVADHYSDTVSVLIAIPVWGAASIMGMESQSTSNTLNYLSFIILPMGVVLICRVLTRRR